MWVDIYELLRRALLLTLVLLPACTSVPRQEESGSDDRLQSDRSTSEEDLYNEVRKGFTNGNSAEVLSKFTVFSTRFPSSTLMSQAENVVGLSYLLSRQIPESIQHFLRAIVLNTDEDFAPYLNFNLAAAYFEAGQTPESRALADKISAEALNPATQIKLHFLRSRLYQRMGQKAEAADALMAASVVMLPSDHGEKPIKKIEVSLENVLENFSDLAWLQSLAQKYPESPVLPTILFHIGSLALHEGHVDIAEPALKRVVVEFQQSIRFTEAAELLRSLERVVEEDPRTVGVLLPMTGKFAPFGQKALAGIELAFRSYSSQEPDSNFLLVIEDSGDTQELAVGALNRLSLEHKAVAVIGPLLSKGIDTVTQRAEDLRIPIVTLSQHPGLKGDFVFPIGVTPKHQAFEIGRYAVQDMGYKRIAILAPNNAFGFEYVTHFWDAVDLLGGEIVGYETYAPDETDFREPVDKLADIFYVDARKRELDAMSKLREESGITKRTRKTTQYFDLEPIVNFDAVFMPDEAKLVSQIMPTFAYRDMDKTVFLGISTWNSPALPARARSHAEGSVFVDSFIATSSASEIQKFVALYHSAFDTTPTAVEALAYDAGNLLKQAFVAAGESPSRSRIRQGLSEFKDFQGVTGKISFVDGELIRKPRLLTVQGGKIQELLLKY